MSDVTNQLMYEVLKDLQAGQGEMRQAIKDLAQTGLRLREDIHNLSGDILRLERQQAETRIAIDRINARLNLVDA